MFVIDQSSYRIDKTAFPTSEEAERRAGEAARMLNRAINVYELIAGKLHFVFRVMPDGSVEDNNPLTEQEQGGETIEAPAPFVLGRMSVMDEVAEVLEEAGDVYLASQVDAERHLLSQPAKFKGLEEIAQALKTGE